MPPYSKMTDDVLFGLLKTDERGAFKEIYDRYFNSLFLHAYKKLRNKEEARDVVQETFATLWDKRERIALTGSLGAYLYTCVRNRILNIICHKEVESTYVQSLQHFIERESCSADHLVRTNELSSLIDKEIAALPSKMQDVFTLSRKKYLSNKEIAARLNLSEETVKKQVHNALTILKSRLHSVVGEHGGGQSDTLQKQQG